MGLNQKIRSQLRGVEALESRELLAVYYVNVSGNDQNAGNADAPWATLQTAANRVRAGDTVLVAPGDYVGFDLRTDGTADHRITLKAQDAAQQPRIVTRNARTPDGVNLEGADYVTIQGFEVRGMPRAGIRSVTNQFVEVLDNFTVDNQVWGVFTGFSDDIRIEGNRATGSVREHGIYVSNSGDRPIIRNNRIWANFGNGIHMNADVLQGGDGLITGAVVEQNVIYDNGRGGGSGINAAGVQDSRFANNMLYNNHASGISMYQGEAAQGSRNNVIVNNTVHQAPDGRWALNITQGSSGNRVYNNILLNRHSFRGSITISPDSLPNFVSNNNIVMDRMSIDDGESVVTLAEWRTATGQDANSFIAAADQVIANWQASDYHLKPGGPAVDRGFATSSAPSIDWEGELRPMGGQIDIGADELTVRSLPGDFDNNGAVDIVDFGQFRIHFGRTDAPAFDLDSDGRVGIADFAIFRANFGKRA